MDNIIAFIPAESSNYYMWNRLLKNKNLRNCLTENHVYIYLYGECNVNTDFERIKRVENDEYKKASMLVTDYSNLDKDFINESKPIIYYQKSVNSNYDYKTVCGKVLSNEEDVVNRIIGYITMNFRLEKIYQKRINNLVKEN